MKKTSGVGCVGWGGALRCVLACVLLAGCMGCDAFVRKFTRKHKKDNLPQQELVLVPQEYKSTMSQEELYRQYFLFWQSWQTELIEALSNSGNHKKQLSCAREATRNFAQLKSLLAESKWPLFEQYATQLLSQEQGVASDGYGSQSSRNRIEAERLKSRIMREFAFPKVKDALR